MGGRGSASGMSGSGGGSGSGYQAPSTLAMNNVMSASQREAEYKSMPTGTVVSVNTYNNDGVTQTLNHVKKQSSGNWKVVDGPVNSSTHFKKKTITSKQLSKHGVKVMWIYD